MGERFSFSRLTDAADVLDLAEVETRRRHQGEANEVCAVRDGAEWLPSLVESHRADAVRILAFPQAAEPQATRLEALTSGGMRRPARMLERGWPVLKHPGPDALVRLADRLSEARTATNAVREHLGDLRKRLGQMQDATARRAGWPMGSGMVESAGHPRGRSPSQRQREAMETPKREAHAGLASWGG